MSLILNELQKKEQLNYREFVNKHVSPLASHYDSQQQLPFELIEQIAAAGYLAKIFPKKYGGENVDMITFGLLNEEFGKGCSSVRGLLTVQNMVGLAILRWGTEEQKAKWLPKLATGEIIAAFCLTEPNIGSDAKHIETTADETATGFTLNGTKKWITFGQLANLFLVFAKCRNKSTAFLVEHTDGLVTKPIKNLLGMRAAMLAEIELDNCHIPKENILGRIGFGFSHVMSTGLDYGRYSVAWGAVGLAQACLESCLEYTTNRHQFEVPIKDHQLIQRMIANMTTDISAARSLCYNAGYLKDIGNMESISSTIVAKYFAAQAAYKAATNAVQIHGANGCSSDYPVQRYLRDAKVMEIIEGSNEVLQKFIAQMSYRRYI